MPGQEELAGGGMRLTFLLSVTTDFVAEDARAFGRLCGGLVSDVLASAFDVAPGQRTLHAVRSSLTPPRSWLRSFLFGTVLRILPSRFSAYSSLQPTLDVLPLHPLTIYPSPSVPSLAHRLTKTRS
ncbi:hypothetical protein B0H13DRAFT_2374446 [Mycena leptocephala]|nr:hypothetical protein B0H13DRAFT_2374446 [Mycena leptocephala]